LPCAPDTKLSQEHGAPDLQAEMCINMWPTYKELIKSYDFWNMDLSGTYSRIYDNMNETTLLYRGERGLPKGLGALAPLTRECMWAGLNPRQAIHGAIGQALYRISGNERAENLKYLQDASDLGGFFFETSSPFVSATFDMRTALLYASGWPGSKHGVCWETIYNYAKNQAHLNIGYINVIKIKKDRLPVPLFSLPFPEWSLARQEWEYLIPAIIHIDELIGHIPLNLLVDIFSARDLTRDVDKPLVMSYRPLMQVLQANPVGNLETDIKLPCCGQAVNYGSYSPLAGNGKILSYNFNCFEDIDSPIKEYLDPKAGMKIMARLGLGVFCSRCQLLNIPENKLNKESPVEIKVMDCTSDGQLSKSLIGLKQYSIKLKVSIKNKTDITVSGVLAIPKYGRDSSPNSEIDIGAIHVMRHFSDVFRFGFEKNINTAEIKRQIKANEIAPRSEKEFNLEILINEYNQLKKYQDLIPIIVFFSNGMFEVNMQGFLKWKDYRLRIVL
jgi:hypothetical protein